MSALDPGGVLSVNDDGTVVGNIGVGEVNHHVLSLQAILQATNIHICNRTV